MKLFGVVKVLRCSLHLKCLYFPRGCEDLGFVFQVGLLGMARTLQKDLDRIANQADTTTAEGLHSVLTGAPSGI